MEQSDKLTIIVRDVCLILFYWRGIHISKQIQGKSKRVYSQHLIVGKKKCLIYMVNITNI